MKQAGNKRGKRAPLSLLSIFLLLIVLIPPGIVLSSIFLEGGDTWNHIKEVLLGRYILNTFILSLSVLLVTAVIGVTAAYIVTRYEFPLRGIIDFMLILPMAIPGYIGAIVYSGILDFTGPIQSFIRRNFDINLGAHWFFDIMNIRGAIFIISLSLFPYIYLPVKNALNSYGLSYIEPAISLGKRNWFIKILLPVIFPSILGGGALVLMEVLNDFGVVNYFGVQVFQTGIFRAWFSLGDLDSAMRLSSVLLFIAIAVVLFEKIYIKDNHYSSTGKIVRSVRKIQLKGAKALGAGLIALLPVLFGFIIPVIQLIGWGISSRDYVYGDLLNISLNSFSLAGISVVVALTFSIVAVLLNRAALFKWVRKVFSLITIGYAIPGTVIAVGVMVLFGAIDRWQNSLIFSGTLFVMVYAYNIRFMAVAYKPLNAGMVSISSKFNEASSSLGMSRTTTLFRVELPLLKRSILVSSILLFVDILKELPLTMILRPFNFDTLATRVYELAGDEMIMESAGPALLLITIGLIPIFILNRLSEKRYESKN